MPTQPDATTQCPAGGHHCAHFGCNRFVCCKCGKPVVRHGTREVQPA